MAGYFTEKDRLDCITALNQRLRPADLRKLIPEELAWMITAVENPRGVKRVPDKDLAEFLIDLHGPELLRDSEVRSLLVKRATDTEVDILYSYKPALQPPRGRAGYEHAIIRRNWHPGKAWAMHFVRTLGLPGALAGVPDGGEPPAYEDVDPYVPLPDLHDFQEDLLRRVLKVLDAPASRNRAILSLPTGAGKTRTAVEALVRRMRQDAPWRFVLWIAQREELCEQAVEAFRQVWIDQCTRAAIRDPLTRQPSLRLFRVWSSRAAPDPSETGVIVAGIDKLAALCKQGDGCLPPVFSNVGVVVVDEAHHAIAPEYTRVFGALGLSGAGRRSTGCPMIGLTATPYRTAEGESLQLVNRFQKRPLFPPWDNPIQKLRQEGILAEMKTRSLQTNCEFTLNAAQKEHVATFHDLPPAALKHIGNDRERNAVILKELLGIPVGQPVLFFGCSVEHARAMALLLRRRGRSAAVVTGVTPTSLRRSRIEAFRGGELQFLCNYGVLATGFDAPKIEVVVIARPTSSPLVYEQMVGRGMRGPKNGGTKECLVIDLVDIINGFGDQMSYARYWQLWAANPTRRAAARSDD